MDAMRLSFSSTWARRSSSSSLASSTSCCTLSYVCL
jgi:hypothetical protein